jgi:hypothetical protein
MPYKEMFKAMFKMYSDDCDSKFSVSDKSPRCLMNCDRFEAGLPACTFDHCPEIYKDGD